jgi:hypothetical protein
MCAGRGALISSPSALPFATLVLHCMSQFLALIYGDGHRPYGRQALKGHRTSLNAVVVRNRPSVTGRRLLRPCMAKGAN